MQSRQTIGGISVYVPTGAVDTQTKKLAPRLTSLRGARIGILDNCKEFADVVLQGVAEALQRDHGVELVKFWQKSYGRGVRRGHQRRRSLRLFDTLDRA